MGSEDQVIETLQKIIVQFGMQGRNVAIVVIPFTWFSILLKELKLDSSTPFVDIAGVRVKAGGLNCFFAEFLPQ